MFVSRFVLGLGIGPKSATARKSSISFRFQADGKYPRKQNLQNTQADKHETSAIFATECAPKSIRGALTMVCIA